MRCIVAVLLEADQLSDVRVRTRGVRWLTSAMGAAWATLGGLALFTPVGQPVHCMPLKQPHITLHR